jgi:hypothetical protein
MLLSWQPYFAGIFSGHVRTAPPIWRGWFFENLESLGYGDGIDYAYTMVHRAPQAAQNPHVIKK